MRGFLLMVSAALLVSATSAVAHDDPPTRRGPPLCGIDVWARDGVPTALKGKRFGLVTNVTGRTFDGKATVDVLRGMPDVKLVALFGPEHGIRSDVDAHVPDAVDPPTGLPVWSLYGKRRKPDPDHLKDVDVLVYDIQDIGARFYTYISTMGLCMEAAAAAKIPFVVLDRPNPIAPAGVGGPIRDADKESFTAWHTLPVMHGMTVGELATMFNAERGMKVDLTVVRCERWNPDTWHDEQGCEWVNPSPNIRRLEQALLYPGIGLLETTNVSVGRGTDTPFEVVVAPWVQHVALADHLRFAPGDGPLRRRPALAGLTITPVTYTPTSSTHKGVACRGIRLSITDRRGLDPLFVGITVACVLRDLHPKDWKAERYSKLLDHDATMKAFVAGATPEALFDSWRADVAAFTARRAPFLLYERGKKDAAPK